MEAHHRLGDIMTTGDQRKVQSCRGVLDAISTRIILGGENMELVNFPLRTIKFEHIGPCISSSIVGDDGLWYTTFDIDQFLGLYFDLQYASVLHAMRTALAWNSRLQWTRRSRAVV